MTTAGHASLETTKRYLHLAGTVFRQDAERLSLARTFYPGFYPPERTSQHFGRSEGRSEA
jgi:hypothetical protein